MASLSVIRLLIAVVALVIIAAGAARFARAPVLGDLLIATVRGTAQLFGVALVIGWIFTHPGALPVYLTVMLTVATLTATRRSGQGLPVAPRLAVAISVGAGVVIAVATVAGAVTTDARTLLPYAAQVIGGAMIATSLAAGRMRDDVATNWDEVEAALALGAHPGQAVARIGQRAVARSLVPPIDQLAGAGLVTLPGAFVGLLLAGAAPLRAAELQLLVLVGMLAAETVAACVTVVLVGPALGRVRPANAR